MVSTEMNPKEYSEGAFCYFFSAVAKIYSLSDEFGNVFYVGCTIQSLKNRLGGHIAEAKLKSGYGVNRKKTQLIRDLNFKITATILDTQYVSGRNATTALKKAKPLEHEWILKYRKLGHKLLNAFPVNGLDEAIGYTVECDGKNIDEKSTVELKRVS